MYFFLQYMYIVRADIQYVSWICIDVQLAILFGIPVLIKSSKTAIRCHLVVEIVSLCLLRTHSNSF